MAGATFPPSGPTVLSNILASYVYKQYEDDANIQALCASFNTLAQAYQTYLTGLNLPVYPGLAGPVLDWMAEGLYGIARPVLQYGSVRTVGPLNTYGPNTVNVGLNTTVLSGGVSAYTVNDDIFKRIITWKFFKGDGLYFNPIWLKRRIMRFLTCPNGAATNIDQTYPVSVAFGSGRAVTITVTASPTNGVAVFVATLFQAAVASGALQLPFQYVYTVNVVNGGTGLGNNSGVLQVLNATGWPTSSTGLAAGALWTASGGADVKPGATPNPTAPPVIYGYTTSGALLALGGGNLPTSDPANLDQLWNNAGIVCVSSG